MTWIKTAPPSEHPAVREVLQKLAVLYPKEYDPSHRHERILPDSVKNDSIMLSHSLIPQTMYHYINRVADALGVGREWA